MSPGRPVLLSLLVLAVGATTADAFSFSVEPSRVQVAVPSGKRRGRTVQVDNSRSDAPVHLKLYVRDVIYRPDGTQEFPPGGSTEWSCASWLTMSPQELDVPAGQRADVRISITVPEGQTGGHYAIVFFESTPTYVERGVGVNFRIGALIEVTVPHTEVYQAKLVDVGLSAPHEASVEIFNEGNVLVRPKGKLKLFDAEGKRAALLELNPYAVGILPKTVRKFRVDLGSVTQGTYRLKAEVDYGTRYLLVGERTVSIQ